MIPIARAVAAESVVRCAPVSIVAVILRLSSRTGKNKWLVGGRPADLDFGIGPLPSPVCTSPFSYSDIRSIRQVEIDIEPAEHVGSEDAVDRR